jgi:hypothetical protein
MIYGQRIWLRRQPTQHLSKAGFRAITVNGAISMWAMSLIFDASSAMLSYEWAQLHRNAKSLQQQKRTRDEHGGAARYISGPTKILLAIILHFCSFLYLWRNDSLAA